VSLLTVCRAAVGACGFAVPSFIIGNSDDTAALLLALINKAGKKLALKPWQILQKEYTFATVAAQATYAFPSDLGYFLDYTAWDRTQFWALRGSLTPSEWQRYKSGSQTTTPRTRFRVKAGAIYLDPTPGGVDNLVIEYVSKNWVADSLNVFSAFSADVQTSLISEDLLELELTWRFLERKGLAYAEAKNEAEEFFDSLFGRDVPKLPVNAGTDYEIWPPLPTLPTTGYS
jgi:hypothetical protein